MTVEELEQWRDSFEAFHARFGPLLQRAESREQAAKYLRGLLSPAERKNSWQVAEAVGDRRPDQTQRLLYQVPWNVEAARDILQEFVIEQFGDPDGVGIVDETSFVKKGTHSVGVQRQYCGVAGKRENCQVATVLSYASRHGQAFLDRRLSLPEAWCRDPARRARARVPEEVVFETKPQQAMRMLARAWARGVPMRWVTGDEVYGDAGYLRDAIRAHGRWYVLAVSSHTLVWRPHAARPGHHAQTVAQAVATWTEADGERLTVADGEQGPRVYAWGRRAVVESRDNQPGPAGWLLARRSVSDPTDMAYFLVHTHPAISLRTVAQVAATRYTVERCIEEATGETGLDHYEVRYWHSWYRHITLSLMAHAWLASIRAAEAKQGSRPQTSPA